MDRFAMHAALEERNSANSQDLDGFAFYGADPAGLRDFVARELQLVLPITKKRILFIGSGPLPYRDSQSEFAIRNYLRFTPIVLLRKNTLAAE